MKLQRILFLVLVVVAAAQIWHFYPQMPEKMASHFDGRGEANAWMPRDGFMVVYLLALGLTAVTFNVLPAIVRILPNSVVNLPHKQYWLSAEHRGEAVEIIARHMNAAGNATIALLLCVFQLVFRANLARDARLGSGMWILFAVFLAFIFGWSIGFIRAFRLPPGARDPGVRC